MTEPGCTCRPYARCLSCIERDGLTKPTDDTPDLIAATAKRVVEEHAETLRRLGSE